MDINDYIEGGNDLPDSIEGGHWMMLMGRGSYFIAGLVIVLILVVIFFVTGRNIAAEGYTVLREGYTVLEQGIDKKLRKLLK